MYSRVGKEIKVLNATEEGYIVPGQLMDVFMVMLRPLFILMVPLLFAVHYYFTGKWKKIWSCIQSIDKEIMLSDNFIRQSRKRCIFTICLFFFAFFWVDLQYNVNIYSSFNIILSCITYSNTFFQTCLYRMEKKLRTMTQSLRTILKMRQMNLMNWTRSTFRHLSTGKWLIQSKFGLNHR